MDRLMDRLNELDHMANSIHQCDNCVMYLVATDVSKQSIIFDHTFYITNEIHLGCLRSIIEELQEFHRFFTNNREDLQRITLDGTPTNTIDSHLLGQRVNVISITL
jgi:hypothetical protein